MSIDNRVITEDSPRRFVTTLQRQLVRENPSALPLHGIDGEYGPETEDWVRRFQERKGLTVDGIAGPETLGRLRNDIIYRPGDSGNGVELLQEDLMYFTVDLSPYGADGDYGGITEQGVKDFQFFNSLVVDGVAGPDTFYKIDELYETILIQQGDEGAHVRRIQTQLNEQEEVNLSISVDGIYGLETVGAIEEFQEAVEIHVDGIVGPITMNALDVEAYHPYGDEQLEEIANQYGFYSMELSDDDIKRYVEILVEDSDFQENSPEGALADVDNSEASVILTNSNNTQGVVEVRGTFVDINGYMFTGFIDLESENIITFSVAESLGGTYTDQVLLQTYNADGELINSETTWLDMVYDNLERRIALSKAIDENHSQATATAVRNLDIDVPDWFIEQLCSLAGTWGCKYACVKISGGAAFFVPIGCTQLCGYIIDEALCANLPDLF
ncbi:peptidoglycan-binding domain-containing protein [Oceanobacillus manasiensis]|uniref:peptidoglycan-binding domain-containing protein n=1 Tax=Oceanobacillus manasiensis TaxID=586413 RepID=UPI000694A3B2|nr:peptidoglycan-binding protein [Oceanobacillus manasiensis]